MAKTFWFKEKILDKYPFMIKNSLSYVLWDFWIVRVSRGTFSFNVVEREPWNSQIYCKQLRINNLGKNTAGYMDTHKTNEWLNAK